MSYKWYKDNCHFYKQEQTPPYTYSYISLHSPFVAKDNIDYHKSFNYLGSLKPLTITDIINLNPKDIHYTSFIKEYLESLVEGL